MEPDMVRSLAQVPSDGTCAVVIVSVGCAFCIYFLDFGGGLLRRSDNHVLPLAHPHRIHARACTARLPRCRTSFHPSHPATHPTDP